MMICPDEINAVQPQAIVNGEISSAFTITHEHETMTIELHNIVKNINGDRRWFNELT